MTMKLVQTIRFIAMVDYAVLDRVEVYLLAFPIPGYSFRNFNEQ